MTALLMHANERRQGLMALTLGAIGVVYGDLGTSPLYTVKEVFGSTGGVPLDRMHLIGAASVIFWALMLVVTLKYVTLILRADNRGEGGIMALTALASHAAGTNPRRRAALLLFGLAGAALFYGDSVITPAISVLSAVEGLEIATPALKPYVLPISVGVLVALFVVQRHGTGTVGKMFGPVMVIWFLTIATLGAMHIAQEPRILVALNPVHAVAFVQERGWHLLAAVGAIVLALTGAEALYADMGHFGKTPIRVAWLWLIAPALTLNYFGQCAMLMMDPTAIENPFFRLFPRALLIPAVALAAIATVIASQAVISGAYSMTKQAVQLGFLPRLRVLYTSAQEMGQIYVPQVNWALLIAVLAACIGFGNSSALASAYGIAVTMTMLITTALTFFVVRHAWGYPLWLALAATGVFLTFDTVLVLSCLTKFLEGGWFPLAMGIAVFAAMSTWKRGRELLIQAISTNDPELLPFITVLSEDSSISRVPRTAVYAVANPATVPQALLHNLKHNFVLHEQNVILTVEFHEIPWVAPEQRMEIAQLVRGFWQVRVHYGFMDAPDVPQALSTCAAHGLQLEPMTTSYFLSREVVVSTRGGGMADWREKLFATMARNAGSVAEFFKLPNNAVIELGARVQI